MKERCSQLINYVLVLQSVWFFCQWLIKYINYSSTLSFLNHNFKSLCEQKKSCYDFPSSIYFKLFFCDIKHCFFVPCKIIINLKTPCKTLVSTRQNKCHGFINYLFESTIILNMQKAILISWKDFKTCNWKLVSIVLWKFFI